MRNDKGQFIKGHSLGEATRFGQGNKANTSRCHVTGRMISSAEAARRKAERIEFLLETVDHLQSVVESAFKELDAYEFDTVEARAASSLIGEAEQQIIDAKAELETLGFVMKRDQVIVKNMPASMGKTCIIDMGMASELKTIDTSRMKVNIVIMDEIDKDAQTIDDMIATDGLRIREEAHDGPSECRTQPECEISDRVPVTLAMWAEDVDGAYSDRMNARAYAEACRETDEDNAGVEIPDWLLNGNEYGEQVDPNEHAGYIEEDEIQYLTDPSVTVQSGDPDALDVEPGKWDKAMGIALCCASAALVIWAVHALIDLIF